MNFTAIDFPPEIKVLEIAALKTEPSLIVKVPRIAAAPASLECREVMTLEIGRNRIILGQVVAIHVKDEFIDETGHYIRAEELHADWADEWFGRIRENERCVSPDSESDL